MTLSVLLVGVAVAGCGSDITADEARDRAEARIARYAEEQRVGRETFGDATFREQDDGWTFEYVSKLRPSHNVVIIVSRRGRTELTFTGN